MGATVAQQAQQETYYRLSCGTIHSIQYPLGSDAARRTAAAVVSNVVAMPSYYPLLLIKRIY